MRLLSEFILIFSPLRLPPAIVVFPPVRENFGFSEVILIVLEVMEELLTLVSREAFALA